MNLYIDFMIYIITIIAGAINYKKERYMIGTLDFVLALIGIMLVL